MTAHKAHIVQQIQEWRERYEAVEDEYEAAMKEWERDVFLDMPARVYENHDDALADLAHEASGLFADLLGLRIEEA